MIDQECLQQKIDEWKKANPSLNTFYRPKEDTGDGKCQSFLFVHQEKWQRDLLQRYGDEILLLDATHKTTRYAIPLFFLVVPTNLDYQIVATFVTENESFESILEALKVVKSWNPSLKPLFAMTDYCKEEINSLECVFPGCEVLICDFHREQAWGRWLKATKNGCSGRKDDILPRLRRIARSKTIEEMNEALISLRSSEFWEEDKYNNLREYIENYWLQIKERWVWAYRKDRFMVNINTNNGVERQNESFKYSYLQRFKNSSLTGMLTKLIENFLPDKYTKYTEENYKMDSRYRKYNSSIPLYLLNRPHHFVKHCMEKIALAKYVDLSGIVIKGQGEFVVHSFENIHNHYIVKFGDEETMPSCTCPSWKHSRYLCKHFFAIFRKYPEVWSWNALSNLYKKSPFLTLDNSGEEEPSISDYLKDTPIEEDERPFEEKDNEMDTDNTGDLHGDENKVEYQATGLKYGTMARDLLTQLRNISYEFDDASENNKELFEALSPILQGCKKDEVNLLDSSFNRSMTLHTKRQICCLLKTPASKLTIRSVPVQQQTGGVDCGLFAISFIQHLAQTKMNPTEVWFDQGKMRNHALKCLRDNILHPFPTKEPGKRRRRAAVREFKLDIFCVCRTIWSPSDARTKGKEMVECDECGKWFHRMCLNIPEFEGDTVEWECPECIKNNR
uniref:Uncharacterized protein n=1 Tax=Clytia hemisphaerica TaxID=252671 RepID=A0A7M5VBX8_9CNID